MTFSRIPNCEGLFKQQELMKSTSPTEKMEVYIRQATADTYRQVLREIRQKEIYKLIIDTNPKHINKFFRTVILFFFFFCLLKSIIEFFFLHPSQHTDSSITNE